MAESQHCSDDRFGGSGISSIIFAPPQQNSYLSIVTSGVPLLDALAFECLTTFDESISDALIVGSWLRDTYGQRNNVLNYSADYLQQTMGTSSVTLTLLSYPNVTKGPSITARRFPFGAHLDLLTSPVEGTFFDPDDFVDR